MWLPLVGQRLKDLKKKKYTLKHIEQVNGCIIEALPRSTGLRMKSVFLSNSLISAVKVQLSTVLNHHWFTCQCVAAVTHRRRARSRASARLRPWTQNWSTRNEPTAILIDSLALLEPRLQQRLAAGSFWECVLKSEPISLGQNKA